jgi:guanine deaminase
VPQYGEKREPATAAGFDDSFIYRQMEVPRSQRVIPMIRVADQHATRPFEEWASKPHKTPY